MNAIFEYMICNIADKEIFKKQCAALEKKYPNLKKEQRLQDADDSEIQIYNLSGKKIRVYNSCYLNEVYVRSDVDLMAFF